MYFLRCKLNFLIFMFSSEQVLHLWLEALCSSLPIVQKWYHPWSYLLSPGWVQIKCELRLLSKFTFYLPPDGELPKKNRVSQYCRLCFSDVLSLPTFSSLHDLFSFFCTVEGNVKGGSPRYACQTSSF